VDEVAQDVLDPRAERDDRLDIARRARAERAGDFDRCASLASFGGFTISARK